MKGSETYNPTPKTFPETHNPTPKTFGSETRHPTEEPSEKHGPRKMKESLTHNPTPTMFGKKVITQLKNHLIKVKK